MNIVSLSAIAVPESFENALKSFGANIIHNYRFADHHRYTQQEIINIINQCLNKIKPGPISIEDNKITPPKRNEMKKVMSIKIIFILFKYIFISLKP